MMRRACPDAASAVPDAADLSAISRFAEAEAGLSISADKASLIQSRLGRRLRSLGVPGYREYLAFVASHEGERERRQMIAALTTHVSHFFREKHHFSLLRTTVLPPLLASAAKGGRVRIWSAGCSAGQEAFSIAMTMLDMMPDAGRHDIRVLGSDIDPGVIRSAQSGRFPAAAISGIPAEFRVPFTEPCGDGIVMRPALRAIVRFREMNLHDPWPMRGRFDVIFCRNVVIYFTAGRQAALWARFGSVLAPGGWLFSGHSERVPAGEDSCFAPAGMTTYRLRSPGCRG